MGGDFSNILIAGVDESGRGPLAGPVIAAAVILDKHRPILGLADSKRLSVQQREFLYEEIIQNSMAYAIGEADVVEIDQLNILQASLLAMGRAIVKLDIIPEQILVDGRDIPQGLQTPAQAVIGGDQTVPSISAASIIAKVTRDRKMLEYHKQYPEYGFAQHKGYGTKQHQAGLQRFGPCPIHRRSFSPVRVLLS